MFPFYYGYDSDYREYRRHHGSGIVNNLILNVHDEYRFPDHSGCIVHTP